VINQTKPIYPTVLQLLGIFLIYLAFMIPVILVSLLIFKIFKYENPSLLNLIGYAVTGVLTLWYAWRKKVRLEKDHRVFCFGKVHWLLYLVLVPSTLLIGIFTDPVNILIPVPDFMLEIFRSLSQKDIYTFLMVSICGPIFEELLFRGVVLNGFLKLYNPWKAIILSSLFFGLFHLNPWQFVPAFLIGMLIGYVYWKSGSLLPCLFIHWLNNTAYWLLNALINKEILSLADLFTSRLWYYLSVAGSLILLLASLYLLQSFILKHPLRETLADNKA